MKIWRFIDYCKLDGAHNMAIDEAILEAHLQGLTPPTLRLYGFNPPAVSLGYNQRIPAGLLEKAAANGLQVVKRPTGGRAVLHLDDLTYSFVGTSIDAHAPLQEGFLNGSVAGAYAQICQGLQCAFQLLGLDLEMGNANVPYRKLHDCFGATTGSDLHWQGKKMIGSAQLKRKHAVLQHGSILLNQEQDAMSQLLGEDQPPDRQRHENLFSALNTRPKLEEIYSAIRRGFEKAFDVSLQEGVLTAYELELQAELCDAYVVSGRQAIRP